MNNEGMVDWKGMNMQCIKEYRPLIIVQYKHHTLQRTRKRKVKRWEMLQAKGEAYGEIFL